MTPKSTDAIALLVAAITTSVIVWAFWRYGGATIFDALSTLAMVGLVVENVRLRRKLKMSAKQSAP